jgi:tRNA(fMet)-specific endonuclease VapC
MDEKMEDLICLDSSVLIEYFRKKNKTETVFSKLSLQYSGFIIPSVVHFEIYSGSTLQQKTYWDNLFSDFLIIPFTDSISNRAIFILKELKTLGLTIDFKDLIIGASALNHNFPLATLNEKHFNKIKRLQLITPSSFL